MPTFHYTTPVFNLPRFTLLSVFLWKDRNGKTENFSASPASKCTCLRVPLCKALENSFPCQQIAGSRLKGFNLSTARQTIGGFLSRDCSRSFTTPPTAAQQQKSRHFDLPWVYSTITKFKLWLKLFIALLPKPFTVHHEKKLHILLSKLWIKVFHGHPKTSFPPRRDFCFPWVTPVPSQAPAITPCLSPVRRAPHGTGSPGGFTRSAQSSHPHPACSQPDSQRRNPPGTQKI